MVKKVFLNKKVIFSRMNVTDWDVLAKKVIFFSKMNLQSVEVDDILGNMMKQIITTI